MTLVAQAYRLLEASIGYSDHPDAAETLNALRPMAKQSTWAKHAAGSSGIFGTVEVFTGHPVTALVTAIPTKPPIFAPSHPEDSIFDPKKAPASPQGSSKTLGLIDLSAPGLPDSSLKPEYRLFATFLKLEETGRGTGEFTRAVEDYLTQELGRRPSEAEVVSALTAEVRPGFDLPGVLSEESLLEKMCRIVNVSEAEFTEVVAQVREAGGLPKGVEEEARESKGREGVKRPVR